MKFYDFDLSFDEGRPCFEYVQPVLQSDVEDVMDSHYVYYQEYVRNCREQYGLMGWVWLILGRLGL